jgi:hypothetical protein
MLLNPEGTRHLAFEQGKWLRIYEDTTSKPLTVGDAMALRPSDIDTIVTWTVAWSKGNTTHRADELIDELATGVRVLVHYLMSRAGMR